MTSKLSVDLFEQPFTRVPYENYRKIFRSSQKNIEKELGAVQTTATELSKQKAYDSPAEKAKSIEGMIGRVETLKRKLSELQEVSGNPTQEVMRARLDHLAVAESFTNPSGLEYSWWAETRLDRWLIDWTLRNGKIKTAKQIAAEKKIESLVDIDLFNEIRRIGDALMLQSCTEALAWCNENKVSLRKIKCTLEFELRLQEYIELARANRKMDALAYAKKHLTPWQETHLTQIQQATALLAYRPSTTCNHYKRLYDPLRWKTLVNDFRRAVFTLNNLPSEPLLHLAIYAGLASLKLSTCFDHATKNVDCPVCDCDATRSEFQGLGLGALAAEVPFSHHVNSTIVCGISGKIMDEDNMPMAFPNGHVYSREALEEMSTRNGGFVTCPRTNSSCSFSALKKVFIS